MRLMLGPGSERRTGPGRSRRHRSTGAAWLRSHGFDQYYLSLTPSFRARHASFEEIEELLVVKGMTPDLYYGTYDRDAARPAGAARRPRSSVSRFTARRTVSTRIRRIRPCWRASDSLPTRCAPSSSGGACSRFRIWARSRGGLRDACAWAAIPFSRCGPRRGFACRTASCPICAARSPPWSSSCLRATTDHLSHPALVRQRLEGISLARWISARCWHSEPGSASRFASADLDDHHRARAADGSESRRIHGDLANFRERPAGEWGSEYLRFLRRARREPPGCDGDRAEAGSDRPADRAARAWRTRISQPRSATRWKRCILTATMKSLCGWRRVSDNGAALIGIMRRRALDAYLEKFAEAGVSRGLLHVFRGGAARRGAPVSGPPAEGFAGARRDLERRDRSLWREPVARRYFPRSSICRRDGRCALAAAELRLPPDTQPLRIDQILPVPSVAPADFDFSRSTHGVRRLARRGLSPAGAGGEPAAGRAAQHELAHDVCAFGDPGRRCCWWWPARSSATRGSKSATTWPSSRRTAPSCEPQVKKIAALDKSLQLARARARLLDEFRGRSKYDLGYVE